MADQILVAMLRQGAAAWNAWRKGNDQETIDLTWAYLAGANLGGADLRGANLSEAYLRGADLTGANLRMAELEIADLRTANLRITDLDGTNLSKANLGGANLDGANLRGANFHEVFLFETAFVDVDLSAVAGLETCRHDGPSIIDYRTLQRSGPLPLAFLRGVGLPESFIE